MEVLGPDPMTAIVHVDDHSKKNQEGEYPDFNHLHHTSDPYVFCSSAAALGERYFTTCHIQGLPHPFDTKDENWTWYVIPFLT